VEIRFDLRGQTAGQAIVPRKGKPVIRYNSQLLQENGEGFIRRTVPHETAHIAAHFLHGPRIRPHGEEWRALMALYGADPSRCHSYDTSRSTARRLSRYRYRCGCREHELTSIRHNRVLKGMRYLCRACGEPLRPVKITSMVTKPKRAR
jgi:SprT protein